MRITKTQLRNTVKMLNKQIAQSGNLTDAARMVKTRETVYTAIRMMQTGTHADAIKRFLAANGIAVSQTSGKDKSTWDTKAFTEFATRGCSVKQMPMGFKAPRVGNVKVIQNQMESLGTRKRTVTVNGMRKRHIHAVADAARRSAAHGMPDVATCVKQSETHRVTAIRKAKASNSLKPIPLASMSKETQEAIAQAELSR